MQKLNKKTLGVYLGEARRVRKLTQWDIAVHLGYGTAQFVSNWERGDSLPSPKDAPRLASMLGLSAKGLLMQICEVKQAELEEQYQAMIKSLPKKKTRQKWQASQ